MYLYIKLSYRIYISILKLSKVKKSFLTYKHNKVLSYYKIIEPRVTYSNSLYTNTYLTYLLFKKSYNVNYY
jgi:hypothetical protein